MSNILTRSIATLACISFAASSATAADYVWQGGGTTNILDPANWVGGVVPPNDGTHITLSPATGDIIRFAPGGDRTIPNAETATGSGIFRQINVPAGTQILVDTTAPEPNNRRHFIDARINLAGTGPDGNGAFVTNTSHVDQWGVPRNIALTGDTTITSNGARTRVDGGPNRLDLQGHTLTVQGNNEFNPVGTNIYNTSGTIIANQTLGIETTARVDPNVTIVMGEGRVLTSWEGRNHRRESAIVLRNNAALETRLRDRNLTFTGPITVGTGDTGVLRAIIQNNGTQIGNGVDMRMNVMGSTAGAGAIRKEGTGTVVLTGNNAHTGGTILAAGAVNAASDTAFGTGTVSVNAPATVHLSNVGGVEFRDDAQRADPLGDSTGQINPTLTGLHSTQAYPNTRFSYVGQINNTSGGDLLYTFAEQYDDDVYLEVNGTPVLDNAVWNAVSTGQITLGPGEHDIRVSVRNGGGGAGPHTGWNDWNATRTPKGVGISTTQPAGAASVLPDDYTPLGDAFEVYQGVDRTVANNFTLTAPLTLTTLHMNGYTANVTGILSGPSDLTVQGSTAHATDRLLLAGNNTYTGNTIVEGGAHLSITGSHTSAAEYIIQDGATLRLEGTINVTDSANPGTPADLQITNNGQVIFGIGGTLNLDLFANLPGTPGTVGENDKLLVGGPIVLTLGGALVVSNPNNISNWTIGDSWDLVDWGTTPSGTFDNVTLPTLPAGLQWSTADLYQGGTVEVVPEPTTGALLALMAGTMLLRRRRKS